MLAVPSPSLSLESGVTAFTLPFVAFRFGGCWLVEWIASAVVNLDEDRKPVWNKEGISDVEIDKYQDVPSTSTLLKLLPRVFNLIPNGHSGFLSARRNHVSHSQCALEGLKYFP